MFLTDTDGLMYKTETENVYETFPITPKIQIIKIIQINKMKNDEETKDEKCCVL